MNILLLGSGGREHCLAWKINQSPLCTQLYIAPGNAGTALEGINLSISDTDFAAIGKACNIYDIEMIVVGGEEPLVKGIKDYFENTEYLKNIFVFGPNAKCAQLEGSKAFSKIFMQKYNIPTAGYREFTMDKFDEGNEYIKSHSLPIVLKADGLAAGKGVIICNNVEDALKEFEAMLRLLKFGEASKKVVVEEFLTGIEMSVFVLCDGKNYVILPEAKDYKKINEGDKGLNTGGMGAISPVPFFSESLKAKILTDIIDPTINGLAAEEMFYTGIIFIGLIIEGNSPKVIEYNCRFGDPEAQVIIPRIKNDFIELLLATKFGQLNQLVVQHSSQATATVVAVSGGYPEKYETGKIISGLNISENEEGSIVFHAGTLTSDSNVLTNGGRVLAATSIAENIKVAAEKSTKTLEKIDFEGKYYRKDIGYEFNEIAGLQ